MPTLLRLDDRREGRVHEADVSAAPAPPEKGAWLPGAHEDQGRTQSAQAAAGQGAETAHRVTGRFSRRERLTSSAEIQALFQQGKRIDRPSLVVLWGGDPGSRRVAFAVTRQIRGAVRRNRARRRMREAFRAVRGVAPPRVGLVVIAKRGALSAPFPVLRAELRDALAAIPAGRAMP
jgi:ribonuclease P protein component